MTSRSSPPIVFIATALASPILAGSDRSTLPGPSVMTNICPTPTMTVKTDKRQRRGQHASGAVTAGECDRREPYHAGADERPDPWPREKRLEGRGHRSDPLRVMSDASGEDDDQDRAIGARPASRAGYA